MEEILPGSWVTFGVADTDVKRLEERDEHLLSREEYARTRYMRECCELLQSYKEEIKRWRDELIATLRVMRKGAYNMPLTLLKCYNKCTGRCTRKIASIYCHVLRGPLASNVTGRSRYHNTLNRWNKFLSTEYA